MEKQYSTMLMKSSKIPLTITEFVEKESEIWKDTYFEYYANEK